MDASIIAWESSLSRGWSHFFFSMSFSVFAVPTRQGVHWPQDSSEKNLIRLRAAAAARSLSDRITTAAEPIQQPYWLSVSNKDRAAAAARNLRSEEHTSELHSPDHLVSRLLLQT